MKGGFRGSTDAANIPPPARIPWGTASRSAYARPRLTGITLELDPEAAEYVRRVMSTRAANVGAQEIAETLADALAEFAAENGGTTGGGS